MHEIALCQGMVELIEDEQRRNGFERVRRVVLEIGSLSHVEPSALAFAFEVSARKSVADGAKLEIHEIPGGGWCLDCQSDISVERRGKGCPNCGGYQIVVQQGEEMRLKSLEVV